MKRFASTHQVGTALVAGLLISSAVWIAVLGLTGALPDPRRGAAPGGSGTTAPAGYAGAEQFFQAKLDQLDQLAGHQRAASAQSSSVNEDRADFLTRLGVGQQAAGAQLNRGIHPTDRGARVGGADVRNASPELGISDCGWRETECALLNQAPYHAAGPYDARLLAR
jgi:hypothetical protein